MAARPPISPDGLWYWDGAAWRSLLSPDGAFVWTGNTWTPRFPTPPPGAPRRRASALTWALFGGGAAALLALVIAVSVLVAQLMPSALAEPVSAGGSSSSSIPCDPVEQLVGHYHAHLSLLVNGSPRQVPGGIGIEDTCIHWIHTHDTSGLVHVEIPHNALSRTFTLADLFSVWGEPLSDSQVAGWSGAVAAWVQASGDTRAYQWHGGARAVPLSACNAITLEVGAAAVPAAYTFPPDFGCGGSRSPIGSA